MSYVVRTSSGELYHNGTKGMHWYRRRYQNEDGTWTEEGKRLRAIREGYGEGSLKKQEKNAFKTERKLQKIQQRKKQRMDKETQRKVNQIKAKRAKAEYDAKKAEENRQKKIKTGDVKTIMDMQKKGQLSNQELQEAINRLRLQNQLNDLAPKKKTSWDKLNDFRGKAETVANLLGTGKKVMENVKGLKSIMSSKEPSAVELLQSKGKNLVNKDILDMADKLSSKDLQDMLKRTDNLNTLWKNERGSGSGKSGGKGGNKDYDYYDIIDRLEALENK